MPVSSSKRETTTRKNRKAGRQATIRRVGGSFIVTLPKEFCDELKIELGTAVDFELQGDNGILMQPRKSDRNVLRPRRPIKTLLKQGKLNREIQGWDDDAAGEGELA